jgi:protein TonB
MKTIFFIIIFTSIFFIAKGQQTDSIDYGKLFKPVNRSACYHGSDSAFFRFFLKNFRYPKTREGAFGKIVVEFTVEKDGSLSDIHVIKNISPEVDQEVIRVVKLSKRWYPSIQNGRPARVTRKLPIYIEPPLTE